MERLDGWSVSNRDVLGYVTLEDFLDWCSQTDSNVIPED